MSSSGYGAGGWGSSGWGGPVVSVPRLLSAIAISENVVQMTFSAPLYFSGMLDLPDASSRRRYAFAPVAGTFGQDGTPAKPIGVASVAVVQMPGLFLGQVINLTSDRPMTPSPARYTVACNGLFGTDAVTALDPAHSSATFEGVTRVLQLPQMETLAPRGDIAMPQSGEATQQGIVGVPSTITLGSFVVAQGDYATQTGLVEYKERCYRRMVSVRDSFLHLAGKKFGAGLLQYGKRLGSAQVRTQLAGAIEQQVGQEPETAAVSCKTTPDPQHPGKLLLVLLAKTRFGKSVKIVTPVTLST